MDAGKYNHYLPKVAGKGALKPKKHHGLSLHFQPLSAGYTVH